MKKYRVDPLGREQASRTFFRPSLPLVAVLASLLGITGCALTGSKAADPSSATPIISVNITQAPPASMVAGKPVPVSATVSNDPADAGVDWVAICSLPSTFTNSCGTFSPAHTASGATTTFTAPPEVPTHGTTLVTALSTTNRGVQAVISVTVLNTVTGIAFTQPPPASAPAGATISVATTVVGDSANLGVDWAATCGTAGVQRTPVNCTSVGFPPGAHSTSGGAINFEVPPPATIPNIVGSIVTLTAFATADHSFSATVSFTVTTVPTISFTELPPSTMLAGATITAAAVVAGDTTNAGIDWAVPCLNDPCGSISPTHTKSGETVTYTAPNTPSVPNLVVPIQASSTAFPQAVVTANVSIIVPLSVTITQGVPNGSIIENTSASLIATVQSDPANGGVDWAVTCGSPGACGSFSTAHTASGAATTFAAPSAVPAGNSVTITATSRTDKTKSATQIVTVTAGTPPDDLLNGTFVIVLTAKNSSNGPFGLGGTITGDGGGNISSAHLDVVDASGNAAGSIPVKTSTYSITSDGRGVINLVLNDSNLHGFGVNGSGAITLSVAFVTSQHAVLTETDSFGNGAGTLDLQNSTALASLQHGSWNNGTYSLELSGSEASSPYHGYFQASALTLTNVFSESSYSYVTDLSDNGRITSVPFTTVPQNFFLDATNERYGELAFGSLGLGLPIQLNLDVWLIDANHFVVTDWVDPLDNSANFIVAGYLTIQPSSPSLLGTYAFTEAGATSAAQPQAAGGILTCGSSGILDVTPLGGTPLNDQSVSATCAVAVNGRGGIAISGASAAGVSQFAAYPTLDQGLYLIELDGGSAGTSGSSGAGVALQQTLSNPAASALSGKYASSFLASTPLGTESFAGQIISDGVSTLSGAADVNSFNGTTAPPAGTPSPGATATGSFTAGSDGRFPLTLTIAPATGQPTPEFTTLHSACYIVDANTCLLLGLDTTAPGTGVLLLQNTGL